MNIDQVIEKFRYLTQLAESIEAFDLSKEFFRTFESLGTLRATRSYWLKEDIDQKLDEYFAEAESSLKANDKKQAEHCHHMIKVLSIIKHTGIRSPDPVFV